MLTQDCLCLKIALTLEMAFCPCKFKVEVNAKVKMSRSNVQREVVGKSQLACQMQQKAITCKAFLFFRYLTGVVVSRSGSAQRLIFFNFYFRFMS